jgi:hypothetical protein
MDSPRRGNSFVFKYLGGCVAALGIAALSSFATQADASHGRGASIVPSVSANGILTLDMVGFWRQQLPIGVCTFPHDCMQPTVTGPNGFNQTLSFADAQAGASLDTSDIRRAEVRQTNTFDISNGGAGTYNISWSSCCWVPGVEGSNSSSYGVNASIVWDGQTANTPIVFDLEQVQQEVVRGVAYNNALGAASGNGQGLTYSTSTTANTGVTSNPDTYAISAAGVIQIDAGVQNGAEELGLGTGTYDLRDNTQPSAPNADHAFEGTITNGDGSFVEFYWVFDGVTNTGQNNLAPTVSDVVVNAVVGDTINQLMTATDPNTGDTLTLVLQSFTGSGESFGPTSGTNPVSGTFNWDTTGFAPGTYTGVFQASDGSLTDLGTLTINLTTGIPGVPLPAGMVLMLTAMAGIGGLRMRKRRS